MGLNKLKNVVWSASMALAMGGMVACSSSDAVQMASTAQPATPTLKPLSELSMPTPDPRVGLGAGLFDAEEAIWNLKMVSQTPSPEDFVGAMNTDLAFKDNYVIQGNYNGFVVWDITNPAQPELVVEFLCPASQSDVSVYGDLLFVSGEGTSGRLDCGTQGVESRVSADRLRGIRIFDISDIKNPQYISNVQTCRGSHTHSVLVDPNDDDNVYVYISGSAPVRPEDELPGCSSALPSEDPNSALFRIEVIKVPLDNPQAAAIVNAPRIFENLVAPPRHGEAPEELAALARAKAAGAYVANFFGAERVVPNRLVNNYLERLKTERGGDAITAEDSTALRSRLQSMIDEQFAGPSEAANLGPDQCHDITLYPEVGLAGGACEGYGILLDIRNPENPTRLDAVADSNFAYWHSATFNNEGDVVIFTDEWGGGTQPKCRATDPKEWGANAVFTINDEGKMEFQSYYKLPAAQTSTENCVAHNGSLIPVPGRDIMVQGWYQGGIVVVDYTDPANPVEMAYHDRGPISNERLVAGGSWSVYWYNGYLVNSEIARGLDIFEMTPSEYITANEIAAANTVVMQYKNAQGQPKYSWPASEALALAYLDQLERNREMDMATINSMREGITRSATMNGRAKSRLLNDLANTAQQVAANTRNSEKVMKIAETLRALAS